MHRYYMAAMPSISSSGGDLVRIRILNRVIFPTVFSFFNLLFSDDGANGLFRCR